MSHRPDAAPGSLRAVVTGLLTALATSLVVLAPSLGLGAETPATTTLTVLLVSLAALCLAGSRSGALVVRTATTTATRWRTVPPVLADRVTAPLVHPRRPRAPGVG